MEQISDNILNQLYKYLTARIDMKNVGNADNSLEIISSSDSNIKIFKENWFKDDYGEGFVFESINSKLNLKIKCIHDGVLNIQLKSKDIRDKNNNRLPIYIDFTSFEINDIPIFDKPSLISYDAPFLFKKNVRDSEIINVYLEWMPFNSSSEFTQSENSIDKKDFIKLRNEFVNYKNNTDKCLESYNFLFNKLFIDYKQEPTQLMDDVHSVCNELLSFVEGVCKKYNLDWWLDYGNLIGAVRHGDYVPWDDEIDIGMMREDYNKLNSVIKKEIKANNLEDLITLVYRQREVDNKRIGSFLQILIFHIVDGKRLLLAGVDVFPYDYLVEYEDMNALNNVFYNTKINYFRNLSRNIDYSDCLKEYYNELNCTFEKTDLIIPGVEGAAGPRNQYPLFILKTDDLFPLKLTKYGDKLFPCPNNSDTYLKLIYGDYMRVPKIIHHHSRVERFRYIKNTHGDFTKYIKLLKKVNK